jgi:hypothetical protein
VVTSVTGTSGARPATRAAVGQNSHSQHRGVRVGHSWDADARTAGRTATGDALALADPKLLMVFASFGYDLTEVLAGVHEAAGPPDATGAVPVIGCSTSGEIGPGPALVNGVVVICLGGAFTVTTAVASGLHERPREVGEEVAQGLLPLPDMPYRLILMLTDALAGDQQEMIRGAYGVLGATVPLIGGGSGDSLGVETSHQFHNGQIRQDSVVAAAIGTTAPIGLSVRHGWHPQGDAMVVTSSTGNEVYTLDDRPALDVYLERHGAAPGIDADPAAFAAFALTRPLAVARRGDVAVRHVLGADPATRALICAAGVSKGAAAWLATGDVESTLAATDAACAEAIEQLDAEPLLALLLFDCAGRRAVLGDEGVRTERAFMSERAGDAPLAGFYTYGEIARTKGVNGFHNQTIVAVALS